jgi:hypothetical protein
MDERSGEYDRMKEIHGMLGEIPDNNDAIINCHMTDLPKCR